MRPSALSSGETLLVARLSAAAVVCLSFSRTLWLPNDLQTMKTIGHQRISTSAKTTTALRPVQTRIQAILACEYAFSSLEAVGTFTAWVEKGKKHRFYCFRRSGVPPAGEHLRRETTGSSMLRLSVLVLEKYR